MKKKITIKKKNEAFLKLSPAQKRVEIAKDVIKQLNSKKLIAAHMVYVRTEIDNIEGITPETQLKKIFDKSEYCRVCGIGSLFVCTVKRANAIVCSDVMGCTCKSCISDMSDVDQETITSYLKKYFSVKQLQYIEIAFESRDDVVLSAKDVVNYKEARSFFAYESNQFSADYRMRTIMQNIIDNKGTFKFTKKFRPKPITK
jgi:hypothetical protein